MAGAYLALLAQFSFAAPEQLPQALLITGKSEDSLSDRYPSWEHQFYNEQITEALKDIVRITVTEDLTQLNIENLQQYDLILNNSLFRTPTNEQLGAFYHSVREGTPYLALHTGLATFLNSDQYAQMIGGHFLGWDSRQLLNVHTFDAWYGYDYNDQTQHPITRSLANFQIEDELYLMHTNTDDMDVIARAQHHPVLWIRTWGSGKVMGLAVGHGEKEGQNPGYRRLLQNSVRWLLGYPILEKLPDLHFPLNAAPTDDYWDLTTVSYHPQAAQLRHRILENTDPELVSAQVDGGRLRLAIAPGQSGDATLTLEAEGPGGLTDTTQFTVSIAGEGNSNLARYHGVSTRTSSNEFRKFTADPALVHDGDKATRWSSDYEDPSWISLDLGKKMSVSRVRLLWEAAHARAYNVEVSADGERWREVYTERNGNGGEDLITFEPIEARYVRVYGTKRATEYGYSLYEFEVYGE